MSVSHSEMIGELFMVGFEGYSLPDSMKKMIDQNHVGGVILFERNIDSPEQVVKLTDELRSLSASIFIAVDQEGGRVSRFHFLEYDSSLSLAGSGNSRYVYESCRRMAGELKALGINMNLAPVLDVNTNFKNPVIGDRSFGSDPAVVAEYGKAAVLGFEESGIIACGKHFPGHGDTSEDSHKSLPIVRCTGERIRQVELRPFKSAIDCGLSAVMTAHVLYPELDDVPATFSDTIVTGLLRNELGFDNIIITDDLEMGAISKNYDIEKISVSALLAGTDILLICKSLHLQKLLLEYVSMALEKGELSEERICSSYTRINKIKEKFL